MATLQATGLGGVQVYQLQNAQSGNGDSTNILDRGGHRGVVALQITSVAGTTVTVNILGSLDGVTYYNIAYALHTAPETVAVASFAITTSTVGLYILRRDHPWRYLKTNMSANTGMTLTSDVYIGQ